MNKNGKGNGIFIILIPVFIILAIIISDTVIHITQNKLIKKDTEKIISKVINNKDIPLDNYYKEIKKLFDRKGYDTKTLVVENNYDGVYVEIEKKYFSIFNAFSKRGEEYEVKVFNIEYLTFKLRKNSTAFIKVNARKSDDEIIFEYSK